QLYNGDFDLHDYSEERAHNRAYAVLNDLSIVSVSQLERTPIDKASNPNSFAVIPVNGAITLMDQRCGPEGTKTKAQYLADAGRNPNIDGVILSIDSPGGEAHAMFDFTNAILEFKNKYNKPIVAHVGTMAASAAFGIAAVCDKIICSDTHTLVGSIGTYITIIDQVKSLEASGIFIKEIYAADSGNKNIEFKSALAGDDQPMLNMLKSFNDRFISIVKSGRSDVVVSEKTNAFSGITFFAEDAIKINLIDGIGNLQTAIDTCTQLKSNYSQTMQIMKIPFQKAWANIASLFSSKVDGDEITEAEITEMNTELGIRQTTIDQLSSKVSDKQSEINALTQKLSDAQAGNDILQAALTETETQRDSFQKELLLRPGTAATTPNAEVELIETTPVVKLDEINEEAKKYR
ncbi:MAG: S49 family peptidase, partial [Bacteroidales bacterium]